VPAPWQWLPGRVARIDERVVGHLQLLQTSDAERSEIKNMAVERAHRGRGIGRT
jgi:ribosomal protein S18 acetylase RimI-like enzyme